MKVESKHRETLSFSADEVFEIVRSHVRSKPELKRFHEAKAVAEISWLPSCSENERLLSVDFIIGDKGLW